MPPSAIFPARPGGRWSSGTARGTCRRRSTGWPSTAGGWSYTTWRRGGLEGPGWPAPYRRMGPQSRPVPGPFESLALPPIPRHHGQVRWGVWRARAAAVGEPGRCRHPPAIPVHAYFNNTIAGAAPRDAAALGTLLGVANAAGSVNNSGCRPRSACGAGGAARRRPAGRSIRGPSPAG